MPRQPRTYSSPAVRQSDYAVEQKARESARKMAEGERAQRRRDMDARIDVNAAKWRYTCPVSR